MTNSQSPESTPPSTVWIIWGALLLGVIILPFLVFGGLPSGPDKGSPPTFTYVFTFAGFIVSTIIRWFFLPRMKTDEQLMTTMIVGAALAEGTGILGLFATDRDFASVKMAAYLCSIVGILQFIPTYYPKSEEPKS